MEENLLKETRDNLYNTDLKHIEANLEKFIQRKEQEHLKRQLSKEE